MSQCIDRVQTRYGIWEQTDWEPVERRLADRGDTTIAVECCCLSWRPSPMLANDVPANRPIEFEVNRGVDGLRRLVPVHGYAPFIQDAWAAGVAILRHTRDLTKEELFSYRAMKLIFDRARAGREHLGRRFAASRDLYVRKTGRGGGITASLLPDYVGRTSEGAGHAWSIRELTERGRAEAVAAGICNPTSDRAIPYGLMRAAQMNPLMHLSQAEARGLICTALFDGSDESAGIDEATIDDVAERLLIACEEHGNDVWERFEAWFSGRNNNLVQSLARKAGFTKLPREVLKAALLQLGLRSYEYVAECLSLFAQTVPQGLRVPLSDAERRVFDAMYLPQTCYGGLPLVLLLERGDLIRLAVTRLWDAPHDARLVGALHRMLQIYADLAPARRAADRRFAELGRALEQAQAVPSGTQSRRLTKTKCEFNRRQLERAARDLLKTRQDGCPHCAESADWQIDCELGGEAEVIMHVACEEHDFDGEFRVQLSDVITAVANGGGRAG